MPYAPCFPARREKIKTGNQAGRRGGGSIGDGIDWIIRQLLVSLSGELSDFGKETRTKKYQARYMRLPTNDSKRSSAGIG